MKLAVRNLWGEIGGDESCRADIFPIKLPKGRPASEVVQRFQQALVESPPPWLTKILGVSADKRLRLYNAETEEE